MKSKNKWKLDQVCCIPLLVNPIREREAECSLGYMCCLYVIKQWCCFAGPPLPGLGDEDFDSIDDLEQLIGVILNKLEQFGDEEQVHEWRNELFSGGKDYTNRDIVLDWYDSIKKQFGPRLEGYESCIKDIPLFLGVPEALPQYDTLTNCGWCTR